MNFYISDLHFFCKSELKNGYFKERPFDNLEEMHEAIMYNWNNAVTNGDNVYILGDNSKRGFNSDLVALMSQLKGSLHLIKGNHDDLSDFRTKRLFAEVCDYKEITDNFDGKSYRLILSHYPIYAWHGQNKGNILLYGHCHDNFDNILFQKAINELNKAYKERDGDKYIEFKAYNVGCMLDYMNYTPRTLKEIIDANS